MGSRVGRTLVVLLIVVCLGIVLVEDVGGNIRGLVWENHRRKSVEERDKS